MSDINFLGNDEEKVKKNKLSPGEQPVTKWTNPGVLRGAAKESAGQGVEDIFADTEGKQPAARYFQDKPLAAGGTTPAANQPANQRPKILNLFTLLKEALFAPKEPELISSEQFKKNKEKLRDYQQALQAANTARKSNPVIDSNVNKKESGISRRTAKQYFRRDQWQAPNVLKTNLIKDESVNVLDWSENINMLLSAILGACLLIAVSYLGLEIRESLAAQKSQEMSQNIQEIQMQIVNAKNGLGDIEIFQKKLEIASSLLNKHIYWTNFFKFWEDNLLKNVYFSGDFSGDTIGKYTFTAVTGSYTDAANQIKLLRGATAADGKNLITDLTVRQARYAAATASAAGREQQETTNDSKTTVTFNLELTMEPDIFYKKD